MRRADFMKGSSSEVTTRDGRRRTPEGVSNYTPGVVLGTKIRL